MKIKGKQLEDTLRTETLPFTTVHSTEFQGDLTGAVRFKCKNAEASAMSKGQAVYISGIQGDVPEIMLADADGSGTMPAVGLTESSANSGAEVYIISFGNLTGLNTASLGTNIVGKSVYVGTTAGGLTVTAPTGSSAKLQNIGQIVREHATAGIIKVGGAGRTAATPNLDQGKFFIGNASNQSSESVYTLPTSDGTEDQVLTTNGSGAVSFATPSVASYLLFGLSTTLNDQTTQYELATVDGVKNGQGLRLPLSGSVTHITLQADCISLSANRDFTIYLYKNGSQETDTYVTTVTQANVFGNSFTLSTPVSFNASDRLMVKVKHSDTGIQTTQHAVTIRVVTSL